MYTAPLNATNPLNDDDLRAGFLRTAVDLLRPVFVYGARVNNTRCGGGFSMKTKFCTVWLHS